MTTLREELDWIARPFTLTPPMPEEIFTECVDELSVMVIEASEEAPADLPFNEKGELIQKGVGDEGGDKGGSAELDRFKPDGDEGLDKQKASVQDDLKRFSAWLNGMGDHFPGARQKLMKLQKQIKAEMMKRPEKMFRALAKWGKNTMLPQFERQVDKVKTNAGDELKAIQSYADELKDIVGGSVPNQLRA